MTILNKNQFAQAASALTMLTLVACDSTSINTADQGTNENPDLETADTHVIVDTVLGAAFLAGPEAENFVATDDVNVVDYSGSFDPANIDLEHDSTPNENNFTDFGDAKNDTYEGITGAIGPHAPTTFWGTSGNNDFVFQQDQAITVHGRGGLADTAHFPLDYQAYTFDISGEFASVSQTPTDRNPNGATINLTGVEVARFADGTVAHIDNNNVVTPKLHID